MQRKLAVHVGRLPKGKSDCTALTEMEWRITDLRSPRCATSPCKFLNLVCWKMVDSASCVGTHDERAGLLVRSDRFPRTETLRVRIMGSLGWVVRMPDPSARDISSIIAPIGNPLLGSEMFFGTFISWAAVARLVVRTDMLPKIRDTTTQHQSLLLYVTTSTAHSTHLDVTPQPLVVYCIKWPFPL